MKSYEVFDEELDESVENLLRLDRHKDRKAMVKKKRGKRE